MLALVAHSIMVLPQLLLLHLPLMAACQLLPTRLPQALVDLQAQALQVQLQ
jgi:hypothetical protein